MDLCALADAVLATARAAVDSLLCHPIGQAPVLKALPLHILTAVDW